MSNRIDLPANKCAGKSPERCTSIDINQPTLSHTIKIAFERPEDRPQKIWLCLPADGSVFKKLLEVLGEPTLDTYPVTESWCVVPDLEDIILKCRDFEKINMLAEQLQEITRNVQLNRYDAELQEAKCDNLDDALKIAGEFISEKEQLSLENGPENGSSMEMQ